MADESWAKLSNFLLTDPEIVGLKKRYHELTGAYLPGWNWDEYCDMDEYISKLRKMVEDAEKHDQRSHQGH